jgi:polysaccharide export outer membrane protein
MKIASPPTGHDLEMGRSNVCGSPNMAIVMRNKKPQAFFHKFAVGIAWLVLCPALHGQSHPQRSTYEPSEPKASRTPELSELAKENYSRVAASSAQIKTVLALDTGLLVELKRWVAKDATDNGQVVEDANLSDDAIFDRLNRDVGFRAVATRLLQRYGYLMPTPNPDSSYAKQEELLLKERARHLVQIEGQEDAEALRAKKTEGQAVERTATCDPQQDENCDKQGATSRRSNRLAPNETVPDENPISPPLDGEPSFAPPSRTLRTDMMTGGQEPSLRDRMSSPELELASSATKSDDDLSAGQLSGQTSIPSSLAGLLGARDGAADNAIDTASAADRNSMRDAAFSQSMSQKRPRARQYKDEDVTPVKMVRRANPYADIPSLYDMYVQAAAWQRPAQRFGMDVFRNTINRPDVIPMDLPVGPDYVVGTGDSLAINLWGSTSQRLVRVVDRAGRVSLPEIGPLLVSGKSLGDVQLAVQRALRTQFTDISADVSLSRLRTVRVYVVGDVAEPAAYDISSLSTPLNALFAAGGVTGRGSLRSIKHYRGKQLVQEVDAYDLLLHGIRSDLERLENGDSLLVPPMGPQITVEGMVRRPAVYELSKETSLADVLELAGGILPTAALQHIEVQRLEAHEKHVMLSLNLTSTADDKEINRQLDAFKIRAGDQVHIYPIASYNEDAIYLQGHVLRPGRYSYKSGMKLTDLISYRDLLPEPASHYAEIVRLNAPDFHPSVESVDLSAALADPASAPALKPLDTVRIFSRYDFEPVPDVWVGGEVRAPGKYHTSGQAHLRDAIYLSGGVTPDAALDSVQLFRTESDGTLRILSVDLRQALDGNPVDNLLLQSRDRVLVHRNPAQVEVPTVYIKGEVAKPGRYPLPANMRVADLLRVAGGLKRSAYPETADLTHFAASTTPGRSSQRVEVKLAAVLSGDSSEDVPLRNGDVLTVRQIAQWNDLGSSVIVRGEVQHPASYGIEPGERLSSLLKRCGGFTPQAYPYGAVLIRREVRELEMTSHLELVNRIKKEETYLKTLPEVDLDQKNAKLTAVAQTETALQQLEATPPIGRVLIHIPSGTKNWDRLSNTAGDVQLRDGDELVIPKKSNYVLVSGQVFNPTAVSYIAGRSAKWYLSQSGGLTQIADKSAMFVIRADGSVLSAKNNSGFWSGDPMSAVLKPGDSIIVPEKAPKIGSRNWPVIMQAAQVASSVALTVAYIHP